MQQTALILVHLDHVADNDTARPKVTLFAPRLASVERQSVLLSIFCDLSTAVKLALHAEDNIYGSRKHCV